MSLLDAVVKTGVIPDDSASRSDKKRYAEVLSNHLAQELGESLRQVGFLNVAPMLNGPGEKPFQGGLGPKKVDVSYSDERNGLMLAISVKTLNFAPFGKNLKNRFSDMCTEAITLHMRFPYSVIGGLFALPAASDEDITSGRPVSTFRRALKLFSTISGREEHTDPNEKFEDFTMMLFKPISQDQEPWVKLYSCVSGKELTEDEYFEMLRQTYNQRNPYAIIGKEKI